MNIDDLKDAWNKDEPEGMHLPMSAAMLGKTTSAIGKIKKNMRAEFIATLIIYPLMFGLLIAFQHNVFLFNISCILLFAVMILNAYYASKFYTFYKSISRYDLNLKNTVYKVAYDLELNTELYKAFNFCITPLFILPSFGLVCDRKTSNRIEHFITSDAFQSPMILIAAFLIVLFTMLIMYKWINYYVQCLYGKHLAGLKQIMDDLGAEA
jgi:hypothetical protein